jgi:predicted RNA-binding Zn-ribbon protein involved in translation (DUF1610 family)
MQNNDFYSVEVSCTNCGFKGKVKIIKEKTVLEKECPRCGCYRLERVVNLSL